MTWIKNNRWIITLSGWVIVVLFMYFKTMDTKSEDLNRREKKQIVKNIYNKEKIIEHYTTEVSNKKEVAKLLNNFKKDMLIELEEAKKNRDTLTIIHKQDTIINHQEEELKLKDSIISDQGVIIDAERYINQSKDTLIGDLEHDLKKTKRRLRISLIGNAVQTGIIIFK